MATLVSDIINQAFLNLEAIAVGESITSAEQTDAFLRLNQLIASLSTEGATVYTETLKTFSSSAGVDHYTLGAGGTWDSTVRAQKVVAWKATSGLFVSGGAPVDFAAFDTAAHAAAQGFIQAAQQAYALEAETAAKIITAMAPFFQTPTFTWPTIALSNAAVPMVLGADTAWPLANVRIFPAPASAASVELTYWVPLTAFTAVSDAVSLPPGFEQMLHSNLAVVLYPQYPRAGGIPPELAALAQNSKAAIIQQNSGQK